jgi:hypothetical protein
MILVTQILAFGSLRTNTYRYVFSSAVLTAKSDIADEVVASNVPPPLPFSRPQILGRREHPPAARRLRDHLAKEAERRAEAERREFARRRLEEIEHELEKRPDVARNRRRWRLR